MDDNSRFTLFMNIQTSLVFMVGSMSFALAFVHQTAAWSLWFLALMLTLQTVFVWALWPKIEAM